MKHLGLHFGAQSGPTYAQVQAMDKYMGAFSFMDMVGFPPIERSSALRLSRPTSISRTQLL
jgi:hypothetical protein